MPVQSLCSEVFGDTLRHALVVDLSERGFCIQRPIGGPRTRLLQLELEIPEIDEIMWAQGEVCFDEVRNIPAADGYLPSGILRTSGVRLLGAAPRHERLLREYVIETWRARRRPLEIQDCLLDASCYLRG